MFKSCLKIHQKDLDLPAVSGNLLLLLKPCLNIEAGVDLGPSALSNYSR